MTAHGGEQEGVHSLPFPVIDHVAHDGGDIVNAAAADTDADARAGLQTGGESTGGKLLTHFGGNVRNLPVRKLLADH